MIITPGKTRRLSLREISRFSTIGLTGVFTLGGWFCDEVPAELKTAKVRMAQQVLPAEPAAQSQAAPEPKAVQVRHEATESAEDTVAPAHLDMPHRQTLAPNALRPEAASVASEAQSVLKTERAERPSPTRSSQPYRRAKLNAPGKFAAKTPRAAKRPTGRGLLQRMFNFGQQATPAARPIPAPQRGNQDSSEVVNAIFSRSRIGTTRRLHQIERPTENSKGVRFKLTDAPAEKGPTVAQASPSKDLNRGGSTSQSARSSRLTARKSNGVAKQSSSARVAKKDPAPAPSSSILKSKPRVTPVAAPRENLAAKQPASFNQRRAMATQPIPRAFNPSHELQQAARWYGNRAAQDPLRRSWVTNSHSGPVPPYRMMQYAPRKSIESTRAAEK